jgi:CMP-N,N'-diacetyllegionaminic acid synthase
VLALIPARGGSKTLPRKNVLRVGDRPLLAWTIEAARAARCVDRLILSSDDEEIIEVARQYGCDVPFVRPVNLATDTTPTIDVVIHALDAVPGYDVVALLQPTSPLRTGADIDAACAMLEARGAPSCVSVALAEQSPYWMYSLEEGGGLKAVLGDHREFNRRQELPPIYVLNGAIYIAEIDWLRRTRSFASAATLGYIMPRERSIDIDTAADFEQFARVVAGGSTHSGAR